MRRYMQKRISELLTSVDEAIKYISTCQNQSKESIFNDCLEAIDAIGDIVEKEKVSQICQTRLEEILLYMHQLRDCIIDNEELSDVCNKLIGVIAQLGLAINNIQTKVEVVFLPYKASMWDSMDSIWRAARDDDRCNVHVVPIPYCDKDEDGKVAKVHYEGWELPKYVTVTDYHEYELKDEHPDIIYIHNPYDGYNRVTSIDPRYYSDVIRQYTEMLVYVPYCIAGVCENSYAGKRRCIQPAMKYVDRIIAQSEKYRQVLIEGGCAEKKVITLGNPKLDTIALMEQNVPALNKEWRDKIKDNKVLLVTFTLGSLLEDDIWIERYNHYLQYLSENESITIIYRPHPLIEATLKAMRPELYTRYMQMYTNLKGKCNVIIDTNANSDMAIYYSNAIISDYSSMPLKYIATGKPVYLLIINPKGYMPDKKTYFDKAVLCDYFQCYFWFYDEKEWEHEQEPMKQFDYVKKMREEGVFKVPIMEMDDFIKMVINGEDYNKEERMNAFNKSMINADGTSGKKVHEYIINELY